LPQPIQPMIEPPIWNVTGIRFGSLALASRPSA
jgi:hypothetical protein